MTIRTPVSVPVLLIVQGHVCVVTSEVDTGAEFQDADTPNSDVVAVVGGVRGVRTKTEAASLRPRQPLAELNQPVGRVVS